MQKISTEPHFLPNIMLEHVKHLPTAIAYTFVYNGGKNLDSINYAELDRKAKLLALTFYQKNLVGERIILLYPTGLEFIIAYLACLYSGSIAIPLNCINPASVHKYMDLISTIINNAQVKAIASLNSLASVIKSALPENAKKIDLICTNLIDAHATTNTFVPISASSETISHLQYTSGSTSTPKGVICTHKNLAHNLFETAKIWKYTPHSVTVSWAPHAHVYGLTAGLLVPLYSGSHAILMSPNDFLTNPISWLNTITSFKATHSGCPNFGYEFCVEQIDDEDLKELNLDSWRVASNGGESIQLNTLIKFFNKFKKSGFKFENFYPAYGMSECTGLIATHPEDSKPVFSFFDKKALQYNHVVELENASQTNQSNFKTQALVSCGKPINGLTIKIVNVKTEQEATPDCIGEVWVSGSTCTQGYWNATDSPIGQLPHDTRPYIKTGDLGFIKEGELFLVGRLKEMIILYGKNYYPADIESDVKNSDAHFANNICAAFSTLVGENEALFIIQEIENNLSEQAYLSAISSARRVLSLKHGIDAYAIVLVTQHSIPKTESGKLQRKMASQKYFKRAFDIVHESIKEPA